PAARRRRDARPAARRGARPGGVRARLARRASTVNAPAAGPPGPHAGWLLDPFDGRADLAAATIRILHPGSFRDDPTRIFRAARYAARLGFALDPDTERLAGDAVAEGLVGDLSGARVRADLLALLGESAATVAPALGIADGLGLLAAVGPGLAAERRDV